MASSGLEENKIKCHVYPSCTVVHISKIHLRAAAGWAEALTELLGTAPPPEEESPLTRRPAAENP